jgi:hypothetical protein
VAFCSPREKFRVMTAGEVSAREFEPKGGWWAVELSSVQILPVRCPVCLSPGTRPTEVPQLSQRTESSLPLTAHYCDLCADAQASAETRRLAWQLSTSLLCVALSTSLALRLGSLAVLLQVAGTLGCGLLSFGLLLSLDRRLCSPLLVAQGAPRVRLLARRRRYLDQLAEEPPAKVSAPTPPGSLRRLFPLVAGLLWLAALHLFGTAKIIVVAEGIEPAIVTIDHRKRAVVAGMVEERPGRVRAVSTLGGRRHIAVFRDDGDALLEQDVTIWPTNTYIAAKLPSDWCFFIETQEYGSAGEAHTLQKLHPPGPVWELPISVDRWFAPTDPRPDLATSGGVRRALRLLPCSRSPLAARRR